MEFIFLRRWPFVALRRGRRENRSSVRPSVRSFALQPVFSRPSARLSAASSSTSWRNADVPGCSPCRRRRYHYAAKGGGGGGTGGGGLLNPSLRGARADDDRRHRRWVAKTAAAQRGVFFGGFTIPPCNEHLLRDKFISL